MTMQRPFMTTLETRRLGGALVALALGPLLLPATAMAADFVVNSLADPGDGVCDETECTLREAIEEANGNEEADTITFDETLAGGTILLSSGELTIADDTADPDLTIDGDLNNDGAPDITVDAQDSSRVFFIATGADATSQGLVITGGIENFGTLTVTGSTISGNSRGQRRRRHRQSRHADRRQQHHQRQ